MQISAETAPPAEVCQHPSLIASVLRYFSCSRSPVSRARAESWHGASSDRTELCSPWSVLITVTTGGCSVCPRPQLRCAFCLLLICSARWSLACCTWLLPTDRLWFLMGIKNSKKKPFCFPFIFIYSFLFFLMGINFWALGSPPLSAAKTCGGF